MADSSFDDRLSLKDLDGVHVAVEDPVPRGLDASAIKQAVEAQLGAAKIPVLGIGVFPTGDPHLRITIAESSGRSSVVAACAQVDFVQIVFLRRNPQNTFNRAQTWKADARVVLATSGQLAHDIQAEIARQVDQFIRDYRAVNA